MRRTWVILLTILISTGSVLFAQEPLQQSPQPTTKTSQPAMQSPGFQNAMSLYRQKRYREAAAAFSDIASAEPDNAAANYFLGYSNYVLGDHPAAVAAFGKAFQIDPNFDPRPYFYSMR